MVQNTRVTAFNVSELLRENQQGELKISVKEVSPQIAISESMKSGREELVFSRFTQK